MPGASRKIPTNFSDSKKIYSYELKKYLRSHKVVDNTFNT